MFQGKKASISIEDGTVLSGKFPPKQLRLVLAWIDTKMNLWLTGN